MVVPSQRFERRGGHELDHAQQLDHAHAREDSGDCDLPHRTLEDTLLYNQPWETCKNKGVSGEGAAREKCPPHLVFAATAADCAAATAPQCMMSIPS